MIANIITSHIIYIDDKNMSKCSIDCAYYRMYRCALFDKELIFLLLENKDIIPNIDTIEKLVEKSYVRTQGCINSKQIADIIDLLCEYGLKIDKKFFEELKEDTIDKLIDEEQDLSYIFFIVLNSQSYKEIEYLIDKGLKPVYDETNEEENHNGFQYQDGLNKLDVPFEREGVCRRWIVFHRLRTHSPIFRLWMFH